MSRTRRGLLWVEVTKQSVYLRHGPNMPAPQSGIFMTSIFGNQPITRREFARWSGIRFPKPGIYGIACDFSVLSRYRKVVDETKVAVIERKGRWVRVPLERRD